MEIFVNNEALSITPQTTLETIILELQQLPSRGIAVAVNNAVVFRSQWATRTLTEGDRITVIKAAQGG